MFFGSRFNGLVSYIFIVHTINQLYIYARNYIYYIYMYNVYYSGYMAEFLHSFLYASDCLVYCIKLEIVFFIILSNLLTLESLYQHLHSLICHSRTFSLKPGRSNSMFDSQRCLEKLWKRMYEIFSFNRYYSVK